MSKTAWYDPTNQNHPGQGRVCETCGAAPGAPCTSTTPAYGAGATGAPIRGLHASRLAYQAPAAPALERPAPEYLGAPTRTRTRRTRRAA